MRKLITIAVMIMILATSSAYAEKGLLDKFPNIKQGLAYNVADNNSSGWLSLTTIDVVTYKEKLSIGAGITNEFDNNDNIAPAVSFNYKIGGLEDLGFTYPLAKLVNVDFGVFASKSWDEEHTNWGVQSSILKVKF